MTKQSSTKEVLRIDVDLYKKGSNFNLHQSSTGKILKLIMSNQSVSLMSLKMMNYEKRLIGKILNPYSNTIINRKV